MDAGRQTAYRPSRLATAGLLPMLLLALPACENSVSGQFSSLTEQGRLLRYGPASRMTAAAAAGQRSELVPLMHYFAGEAGQLTATQLAADRGVVQMEKDLHEVRDWRAVTLVGQGFIDEQCFAFLGALDRLERTRRRTLSDLNALQAATVGIMGAALATQKAIGITGIAFGLAASLFDSATSSVLYELPASAIRAVVLAQRDQLRQAERPDSGNVLASVTSRGLAVARLAEYLQYCAPVTIEANITRVLSTTENRDGRLVTAAVQPAITSALVQPRSAIPPGVTTTVVGQAAVSGPLHALVQRDLVALGRRVRAMTDRAELERIGGALGIADPGAMELNLLRNTIRLRMTQAVGGADAATQRRQLARLEALLGPPAAPVPAPAAAPMPVP